MPLREQKYLYNKSYLSLIGCAENGYIIKLVTMKTVRNSNIACDEIRETEHYDFKLDESVARARTKIFDLAMCNSWDYFFTGTLSPDKYNRFDLEKYHKDFCNMICNLNSYHKCNIKFLIIPERHADGAWHFHGLLSGVPESELQQFKLGDKMGKDIAELVKKGEKVFNWSRYSKKFGFCSLGEVKSRVAVNKYITKYVTKDLQKTVSDVGAHMYYRSRGLAEPLKIKEGFMSGIDIKPTFENDYCAITELEYSEELLQILQNAIV